MSHAIMKIFKRVKCALLLLCVIFAALASCDDVEQQNNTKTLGLQDPHVDATVKAALENGSVSEVVVRKDLLLFPVNAPNLVIAHSQEIHAVPQKNGTNATDGKPVAAEVAEVNEYSLSQLVNDTDNDTTSQTVPIPAPSYPNDAENDSILEPGKLLEIVSGFNLSNGVATEKVPLPSEVQNFSLPKHSIVDLLSKSLPQPDAPTMTEATAPYNYRIGKRSVDSESDDNDDDNDSDDSESTEDNDDGEDDDDSNSSSAEIEKRSVDSDESESDSSSDSTEEDETSSSTTMMSDGGSSTTTEIVKRSISSEDNDDDSVEDSSTLESTYLTTTDFDSSTSSAKSKRSADEDDVDYDSTSNSTEYYDHTE